MLDKFLSYIKKENLFNLSDKVLLAVSGGLDSMVMSDLFVAAGCPIGIAHINHHLRGEESDEDALFVQTFCNQYNIEYFEYHIDPKVFADGNMHAIARDIRYNWLQELANTKKFGYIATAHHQDDSIETFIMHLMRGSGLDGLAGIQPKTDVIIRPLMFATREMISDYAKEKNIPFREDSSNAEDKYLRNKIRQHVLPSVYAADERAKSGLAKSIANLNESTKLLSYFMNSSLNSWEKQVGNGETILDIGRIPMAEIGVSALYHSLKKYGYTASQCRDIMTSTDKTGNRFITNTHEAVLDRNKLIIRPLKTGKSSNSQFQILPPCLINTGHQILRFDILDNHETIIYERGKLFMDFDKLKLPLQIRKKQAGDKITPLGMQGRSQKIKDYLINKKVSQFEKEGVWLLEDQSDIQAVLFYGISDQVKINDFTNNILKISVEPHVD